MLIISKKELFWSGFLVSILWFWWIGYSFIYYEIEYLIPFIVIAIGIIYGFLFYLAGVIENIYARAVYFFLFTFIYPFGFNWLQLELPFINSLLGTSKLDFVLILFSIVLIIKLKTYKKYLAVIPLLFALNVQVPNIEQPTLKIFMANINILQKNKWDQRYLKDIIDINFKAIDTAIYNNNDLVVLPESTFPLVLNNHKDLISRLQQKSKYISIVLGSLYKKNDSYHNSTYFFQNGQMHIAHKVVLIPFGEAVPLPEKLRNFVNNTFYKGASDYVRAKYPTDFIIKGIKFRSAICYEATTDDIFDNMEGRYMISISNNGWFFKSIQPVLQALLLKYYAIKYNVKIFNIANMSANTIIN
ncbi:Apolipoprotein N-acyltransferase / Copper homeostasis protein CutE [hydrothermal vent metagenome]|uniref:Apolipoprotein N-acyltransferase / Copper homeostasis protein CutE n=1 Tax=hydrothermal vent metagenome TaxID=652676 RepID=A0A3B1E7D7_9ZZZZ